MTVLPQLEHELLAAHARRRPSWLPPLPRATWGLAGGVVVALAVASVALVAHRAAPTADPTAGGPAGAVVLARGLNYPDAYPLAGRLYVTRLFTLGSGLQRLDPRTGRVLASRRFASYIRMVGLAHGRLWISVLGHTALALMALDPDSLAAGLPHRIPVAGNGSANVPVSFAVVGDAVWLSYPNGLMRFSFASRRVTVAIPRRHAELIDVAPAPGNRLLVTDGLQRTRIELRDGRTGAVVRRLAPPWPGAGVQIAAADGSSAWLLSTAWPRHARLDLRTLRYEPVSLQTARPRVDLHVLGGILWIAPASPEQPIYCGGSRGGVARALSLPAGAEALAADAHALYYVARTSASPSSFDLVRVPIATMCG